jgi:hypothetical protein
MPFKRMMILGKPFHNGIKALAEKNTAMIQDILSITMDEIVVKRSYRPFDKHAEHSTEDAAQ